jgi:tRNA-specific 2-thiouridylase
MVLGIGGVKDEECNPWFVCAKDATKNIIYVSNGDEDEHLLSDYCEVTDVNWVGPKPTEPIKVGVKFRYRQPDTSMLPHL